MRWRNSKQTASKAGFTIIEVMIVLAVTGAMFVSVALIINGKQQAAQFQTSINEAQSKIRSIGNEVISGHFPDTGTKINCSGTNPISLSSRTAGSSTGKCNYLGKAVHFYKGAGSEKFSTYSIVGIDNENGSLAEAHPFLVAKLDGSSPFASQNGELIDSTINTKLGYGLTATNMTHTDAAGVKMPIGSFAFVQSLNSGINTAGSGSSQHMNVLAFTNPSAGTRKSSLANSQTAEADAINLALRDPATGYKIGGKIDICFQSGTTNKHGIVTVGGASSNLDISTKIGNGSCPV